MNARNELERLLTLVEYGRLDQLAPAQIAEIERLLNHDPALAERLAGRIPPLDRAARLAPQPSDDGWQRVWNNIANAAAKAPAGTPAGARTGAAAAVPPPTHSLVNLWRSAAALAACIILVITWRALGPSLPGGQVRPALNAQIDSLQVFGDRTGIIVSAGDGEAFPVIWVMDNEGV